MSLGARLSALRRRQPLLRDARLLLASHRSADADQAITATPERRRRLGGAGRRQALQLHGCEVRQDEPARVDARHPAQEGSVSPEITWGDSYSADNMLPAFQRRDARLASDGRAGGRDAPSFCRPSASASSRAWSTTSSRPTPTFARSTAGWRRNGASARDGRIVAPPLLSLLDRDRAVLELDRVLALGARLVHIRPGPTGSGRSPADPWYDPFWARLDEARVPVAFHINDYRYAEVSAAWGEDPDPPVREMSAFQWAFVHGDRPIMETFGALHLRQPVRSVPQPVACSASRTAPTGSHYLLTLLDKKKGMGRYGPWVGGRPTGRPSDTFRDHCYVSPVPRGRRQGADRPHRGHARCCSAPTTRIPKASPIPSILRHSWRTAATMRFAWSCGKTPNGSSRLPPRRARSGQQRGQVIGSLGVTPTS